MACNFRQVLVILLAVCAPLAMPEKSIADEAKTLSPTADRMRDAPKTIQWSYLAPENGQPFSDPFAKLTSAQLDSLSFVMRVRRLIADDKISANGEDAKEATHLASKLERQGVDIAWLMVQRDRVRQIRGLQVESLAKSVGKSLQNTKVTLTGYAIPCNVVEGRLREFFLVPTTAACSHEAAPPRLQVVFVTTEQGIALPGRRTPMRVTGKISAETTSRTTFNANGRVMVHSAYALSSPEIKVFQSSSQADN